MVLNHGNYFLDSVILGNANSFIFSIKIGGIYASSSLLRDEKSPKKDLDLVLVGDAIITNLSIRVDLRATISRNDRSHFLDSCTIVSDSHPNTMGNAASILSAMQMDLDTNVYDLSFTYAIFIRYNTV